MSGKYFTDKPPEHLREKLEKFNAKKESFRTYLDKDFQPRETIYISNVGKHVMLKPEEISDGVQDE